MTPFPAKNSKMLAQMVLFDWGRTLPSSSLGIFRILEKEIKTNDTRTLGKFL